MIKTVIVDPLTGNQAEIDGSGALFVEVHPEPPLRPQKTKPFAQFLSSDGAGVTVEMGVNGSVTNVDYYVPAGSNDIYITSLNAIVGYAGTGKPFEFADATALVNGCRLFYSTPAGEVEIFTVNKNSDFIRNADLGIVPTAWEIRHLGALNDYGYLIKIPLASTMPPFGVKLDAKTKQRITMRIQDDCTAATSFNICAVGFERFE